jgi:thiamine-phosphate diphosphorylase
VIRALYLPKLFAVTPDYTQVAGNFLKKFEGIISKEYVRIIQLRSHELNFSEYTKLAKQCASLCSKRNVQLILNRDMESLAELQVTGLHLTSNKLLSAKERPLSHEYLVGASCHNLQEVEHANAMGLDYIFLGPVLEKNSSENTKTLGWEGFAKLARESLIPVYAIGGLKTEDTQTSMRHGGQGVAAIRSIWDE